MLNKCQFLYILLIFGVLWHFSVAIVHSNTKSLLFGYGVQYNASTFSSFCKYTYTSPLYLPQTTSLWHPGLPQTLSPPVPALLVWWLQALLCVALHLTLTCPSHLDLDTDSLNGSPMMLRCSEAATLLYLQVVFSSPLKQVSVTSEITFCSLLTQVPHLLPGTHMMLYSFPHRI